MPPDPDEVDVAPTAATGTHGSPAGFRPGIAVALATTTVVALGLAGTAGWHWKQSHDLEQRRDAAVSSARRYAVTVASYDYRHLDAYFAGVHKIATGSFATQYTQANKDLRGVLTGTKAVVRATVLDAAAESASSRTAVVVLFVDQSVQNSAVRGRATDRNRMRMTLVRRGDTWLVSKLDLR